MPQQKNRLIGLTFAFFLVAFLFVTVPVYAQNVPDTSTVSKRNISILRGQDYLEHLTERLWYAQDRILISSMIVSDHRSQLMAEIYNPIIERARKGVTVRVVTAAKYTYGTFNKDALEYLNALEGVTARPYLGEGIMHSKFIVIDDDQVYNGSANFTSSGISRSEETTIYLQNQEIAEQFADYFDELWDRTISFRKFRRKRGL